MFTDRLKSRISGQLDSEAESYLERIHAASTNMRELIDNLLEFSRANRSTYNFSRLDMRALLAEVVADLELRISETKKLRSSF